MGVKCPPTHLIVSTYDRIFKLIKKKFLLFSLLSQFESKYVCNNHFAREVPTYLPLYTYNTLLRLKVELCSLLLWSSRFLHLLSLEGEIISRKSVVRVSLVCDWLSWLMLGCYWLAVTALWKPRPTLLSIFSKKV